MMARHVALSFGRAASQAVPAAPSDLRRVPCHKKRPDRQVSEAHLHADPAGVIMPCQGEDPKTNRIAATV